MSHVTEVELNVGDLDILATAAQRIGLEFVDQQTYEWFGRSVGDTALPAGFTEDDLGKCEYALRLPASGHAGRTPYEIGVVRRRDGLDGYALLWDSWMGGYGLQEVVGETCEFLRQAYAAEVARRDAWQNGMLVQEEVGADGAIELRLITTA